MHQRHSGLAQPIPFAGFQMDCVAIDAARAKQAMRLVGVEIVAGVGKEVVDPRDLFALLGEVGLHQAVGVLCPEAAQRVQLRLRRGGRESRCDDIAEPVDPMPFRQQGLAVIIGALRRVAQRVGRVAIHTGLARQGPHAPRLRLCEKRVDARRMDRGVAAHGRGPMRYGKIEIAGGNLVSVGGIGETRLLGEGVVVEPIDQPLSPARDDGGLRIVDMGVNEPGHDQFVAVIRDPRLRHVRARICCAHPCDLPRLNHHSAMAVVGHGRQPVYKRVAGEAEGLA